MAHIPVLFKETIEFLSVNPEGTYLDMTIGGFGHGRAICEKLNKKGRYIGIDLDDEAIKRAEEQREGLDCEVIFEKCDYNDFKQILEKHQIEKVTGCLFDLGVSSFQLDEAERGFSFAKDGPLDMRMDRTANFSAYDVVNKYEEEELRKILYLYGEEKFAPQIARGIVRFRNNKKIETTSELVEAIKSSVPTSYLYKGKNPATKTFQAVRIEVNGELGRLGETLSSVIDVLEKKARLAVISFHSLEDRIVKEIFNEKAKGCICPKELPVCVCGHEPEIKILTKSPVTAGEQELKENIRSRSAKLRCIEKII